MDIATITAMVADKLTATQTLADQLITDAKDYINAMQTASEMMYLPNITVKATSDFRPSEQQSDINPPAQSTPSGPTIPSSPPDMVLHDYVAADPISLANASDFADIPTPSADNPKISTGEDGTASITISNLFVKAVMAEIQRADFDSGYVQPVRDGISGRASAMSQVIATRVANRLVSMGLASTAQEILTLAGYQSIDDTRAISNKQREAKVDNDRNMVETAVRIAEMLYQHADAVYARALDVAKTVIEIGDSIYQLQIGIERAAIGIAKTAMETDFEEVNAKESINKLNFSAREKNIGIFDEVATLAIRSLENATSQYELAVARYGIGIDKARALAEFDMSKGGLSEQALSERVSVAIQNVENALTSFITVAQSKRSSTQSGEQVYSEAIRGAMEARNTLIQIGKRDTTTGSA